MLPKTNKEAELVLRKGQMASVSCNRIPRSSPHPIRVHFWEWTRGENILAVTSTGKSNGGKSAMQKLKKKSPAKRDGGYPKTIAKRRKPL
jgi:hypothetical protein